MRKFMPFVLIFAFLSPLGVLADAKEELGDIQKRLKDAMGVVERTSKAAAEASSEFAKVVGRSESAPNEIQAAAVESLDAEMKFVDAVVAAYAIHEDFAEILARERDNITPKEFKRYTEWLLGEIKKLKREVKNRLAEAETPAAHKAIEILKRHFSPSPSRSNQEPPK